MLGWAASSPVASVLPLVLTAGHDCSIVRVLSMLACACATSTCGRRLAGARCILQLAEQPRDVGDLLVDTRLSSRTPGSALGSTTGRRLLVIEASALELVMDPEIDDFSSHETCIPCE